MNFNENEEDVRTKGKMLAVTTFSVISAIVIFAIICIASINCTFNGLTKHKYYVLEINNSNKEEVISLLEDEEKNWCESIYKIEYEQLFPNDKIAEIYCRNEENIKFTIIDNKSKLAEYIFENGFMEKR